MIEKIKFFLHFYNIKPNNRIKIVIYHWKEGNISIRVHTLETYGVLYRESTSFEIRNTFVFQVWIDKNKVEYLDD